MSGSGRPAPTAWREFQAYECGVCGDGCINRWDRPWTKYAECRACFRLPVLEDEERDLTPDPQLAPEPPQAAERDPHGGPRSRAAPEPGEGAASGGSGADPAEAFLSACRQATEVRTDGGSR